MVKKILMAIAAFAIVVGGVAAMSAYEAHIINVTAKIENALAVSTEALDFGTVFPQEFLLRDFVIRLSDSFMDPLQDRVKDVQYKIVQKPKCECKLWDPAYPELCPEGQYAPVDYATHVCPAGYTAMPDLCRFLSKMGEAEPNHVNVPSYFINLGPDDSFCEEPASHIAGGYLEKCDPKDTACLPGDIEDCWTIDLKVPPIEGHEAQDWPVSCAPWTVPTDGADYGCDLWIEVTGFSFFAR